MGELHLDIYIERMRREYNCDCVTGKPQVAYRETITERVPFSYTHKKQSGGSGQYGKVLGYIEPILTEQTPAKDSPEVSNENSGERDFMVENEFSDQTIGINIPSQFIPSISKGFMEACEKGRLIGHKVKGVRFVLEDGQAHSVDSSDMAFRLAAAGAFAESYAKSNPIVLEPIMAVQVTAPQEFQSNLLSQINRRRGVINDSEVRDGYVTVNAQIPLNQMFGYSSDLRSASQGKGEFSMEYKCHQPVLRSDQEEMAKQYQKRFAQQQK
jgi:elongation factor G